MLLPPKSLPEHLVENAGTCDLRLGITVLRLMTNPVTLGTDDILPLLRLRLGLRFGLGFRLGFWLQYSLIYHFFNNFFFKIWFFKRDYF